MSRTEESEQLYLETEIQELSEGEFNEPVSMEEAEECHPDNQCKSCDEGVNNESYGLIDGEPIALSNDALERILDDLEGHWQKTDKDIEEQWELIADGIRTLHKMHLNRAENQFQERLAGVIEEC